MTAPARSDKADGDRRLAEGSLEPRRQTIVIAGIGETGEHLAQQFARDGHDVTLVDISVDRLTDLDGLLDVRLCEGHAGRSDVLRRAGVDRADLFVASSGSDGVNIVASLKAREMGAVRVVAVVDEVDLFEDATGIYQGWLGINLVLNTRYLIAHEISKLIRTRGALAVEDFAENRAEMIQFRVGEGSRFAGVPLSDVPLPSECLIVAIRRGNTLMIPRGDDAVHVGDEILVMGRTDRIAEVEAGFGRRRPAGARCVILGGGTVGLALARGLSAFLPDVTLIERDRDRCDFLSRELDRVTVVHGDGTDVDLLTDEGVGTAEVFAAVSGEDEKNIIAGRLAKELGAERCIALVSRNDYDPVCRQLGLEVVLSPRKLVAREVARATLPPGGVLGVTPVLGGAAEFVELSVTVRSRVAHKSLREAGFPRGAVVCSLVGDGGYAIPNGDTVIQPGMRAVVFTHATMRARIAELFQAQAAGGPAT